MSTAIENMKLYQKTYYLIIVFCICLTCLLQAQIYHSQIISTLNQTGLAFPFGVCSGDPSSQSVIIATHVWPKDTTPEINIVWEMYLDKQATQKIIQGELIAYKHNAYAVKAQVIHLQPNTYYYYRFIFNNDTSILGRTKTLPQGNVQNARFLVASCGNYEAGWFNAYKHMSTEQNIDAVLILGDYIYEYYQQKAPRSVLVRQHIPSYEIITLSDYRTRYAQYRLDKDLQALHAAHPVIAIWDDHEFANNAYKDGADNHQAHEGDWTSRKYNAKKAYFEWLPVQENEDKKIFRMFNIGNLIDLIMLDGRMEGRTLPEDANNIIQTGNTMLGDTQKSWFFSKTINSQATWKMIGNQVIFSNFHVPKKLSRFNKSRLDMWQGYTHERKEILDTFTQKNIKNLLVLTGDAHSSWFIRIKNNKKPLGAEVVTPSISSHNLNEYYPLWKIHALNLLFNYSWKNRHIKYFNGTKHGYVLLDVNKKRTKVTWKYLHVKTPLASPNVISQKIKRIKAVHEKK